MKLEKPSALPRRRPLTSRRTPLEFFLTITTQTSAIRLGTMQKYLDGRIKTQKQALLRPFRTKTQSVHIVFGVFASRPGTLRGRCHPQKCEMAGSAKKQALLWPFRTKSRGIKLSDDVLETGGVWVNHPVTRNDCEFNGDNWFVEGAPLPLLAATP